MSRHSPRLKKKCQKCRVALNVGVPAFHMKANARADLATRALGGG